MYRPAALVKILTRRLSTCSLLHQFGKRCAARHSYEAVGGGGVRRNGLGDQCELLARQFAAASSRLDLGLVPYPGGCVEGAEAFLIDVPEARANSLATWRLERSFGPTLANCAATMAVNVAIIFSMVPASLRACRNPATVSRAGSMPANSWLAAARESRRAWCT